LRTGAEVSLPVRLAHRLRRAPVCGGVGLGCQPISVRRGGQVRRARQCMPDSILSDSKSPRRIFRRGLVLRRCRYASDLPDVSKCFCGTVQRPDHGTVHGVVLVIFVERPIYGSETMMGRSGSGQATRRATAQRIAPPCEDGWMSVRRSTLINRYKTAVPPSVAPAHSLRLRCLSEPFHVEADLNVSQAEIRAGSKHLCL
jgi:hypothetical protein